MEGLLRATYVVIMLILTKKPMWIITVLTSNTTRELLEIYFTKTFIGFTHRPPVLNPIATQYIVSIKKNIFTTINVAQ